MQKVLVGLMTMVVAGLSVTAASAGEARRYPRPAPSYPTPSPYSAPSNYSPPAPPPSYPSGPSIDCLCTRAVVFYGATSGWGDINAQAPGVRVYGEPVLVPSGRIDIQGPPVYVDAPPIRIAAPQIYLHRPEVHVRPSAVTVDAPEIHFTGCADGSRCEPAPRR
jgi:hypothetical protein